MVVPDLTRKGTDEVAAAEELLKLVGSKSGALRLAAQRELIRRILANPDKLQNVRIGALDELMVEKVHGGEWAAAYSAYFVFAIGGRAEVKGFGTSSEKYKSLSADARLLAVRTLGNGELDLAPSSIQILVTALSDSDPRVRAAAITALRRLHKTDAAPSILPLVADADPVIAHLAVRALSELKAVQPLLAALDSADAKVQPGALRALYGIADPAVVDGLIARLPGAKGELRRGILNALCRLANQEAPYEDPKVWWSTRPDTTGPIYQPIAWSETEKITAALKTALERMEGSAPSLPRTLGTDGGSPKTPPPLVPSAATSAVPSTAAEDDAKWLVARMYQTKVAFPGLVELMLAKAGNDTAAKLTAIEGMIRADNSLPAAGITALKAIAADDQQAPDLRVSALRIFIRCAENGGVFPGALDAFAPLAGHDLSDAKLTAVFEDFTRGAHNAKWVNDYNRALHGPDAAKRQLAATVLVNLATGRVGKESDRESAKKSVTKSFDKPDTAAALLTAIARSGAKPLAELVEANLNNPNNTVAEAALFAHQKLGLGGTQGRQIGTMKYEEVFAAVQKGGDAKVGQEMFLRAGCIACHTITPDEPPKGPVLNAVAKIYDRAALTESILKPNAKLAQGFESAFFKTKKGETIEGFVTREGGDSVDVRNIAGQTVLIEKADITERGTRPQSMMPEGLLNAFTPAELANLLAWLESLKK